MSNLLLYLITVLIWGSTWFAITFQLGVVEPEVSLVYRYALASFLLFAWCLIKGHKLRFAWRAHVRFVLLGVLLFGFNYVLAYHAQIYISSALTAICFSTLMWMNVMNTRLFFGTRIESKIYLGAIAGIAGLLILFWPAIRTSDLNQTVALIGAFSASLGNMASQSAQNVKLPVVSTNAWGMLYGAVFSALIAFANGISFGFDLSFGYIGSLLYLSVFGSIIAFGAYLELLGRIGAHKAGYAVVLFPVVALILSVAFEGLKVEAHMLVGIGLVLLGNLIVLGFNLKRITRKWIPITHFHQKTCKS